MAKDLTTHGRWIPLLALVLGLLGAACAGEVGGPIPEGDGGIDTGTGSFDGGQFQNANPDQPTFDAAPAADAFFIADDPPPYCGPDGVMEVGADPGGTLECPADKNRQGCRCETEGEVAACWPGKRINRNQGICEDGMTLCKNDPEFGLTWGPCEGYVLPVEGAESGPSSCRCFSSGTWALTNLSPCIFRGTNTYLYSSKLDGTGGIDCGSNISEPPDVPTGNWSESTLKVDCAGQFELCFTIKAGDVENPQPDDCEIMQECVDVWYPEPGEVVELPALPSWSSPNSQCADEFDRSGGYGEMSVQGKSIQCDEVDDGSGNPYVFNRTNYCPPSCQDTPNAPACVDCKTGGSGSF
ncbi:MAG: hypothetical protein OEZ06_30690 [Myxococcales bacterium]|nr:hypothetical protein [Myxococcales bacterium]